MKIANNIKGANNMQISLTDNQQQVYNNLISEIKSVCTDVVEAFVPFDVLNSFHEVTTEILPLRLYVSSDDFINISEIADKYNVSGSVLSIGVTKNEYRTQEEGVYFAI